MVSLKLSQPELFGPPQLEDPAAGTIGIWPVQFTVGFVPDTVPEVGVAPLATAENRRRVEARTAVRTGERPLTLLRVIRRREGIFFSLSAHASALRLEINSSATIAASGSQDVPAWLAERTGNRNRDHDFGPAAALRMPAYSRRDLRGRPVEGFIEFEKASQATTACARFSESV